MSFAMDVHRAWRADEARRGRTAALSPVSLAGGLALLHAGARGATRDELAHALHVSTRVTAADLLKLETRSVAGFEVWRGQRVFADGRLTIRPEYRNEVGAAFACTRSRVPFASRADNAALTSGSAGAGGPRGRAGAP